MGSAFDDPTAMTSANRIRYRAGADIGGTFTDIVLLGSDGSIATKKISSTPDDYGRAIMVGLQQLMQENAVDPAAVEAVVHGTTVVTNAIIEKKGARTALVTTAGFRDVLELRRIRIPELYNFFYDKVPPLVPRRLRFEVDERMGPHGEVKNPLDETDAAAVVERIKAQGIEALAICLLHSYANPAHERRIAEIARATLPVGVFITCSSDVLPELREYERTSTTVINAYVGPVVANYLNSLLDKLAAIGIRAPLQVMQSNGGIMRTGAAIAKPASIVESGPAAGVIGAARSAQLSGYPNLVTLDMGGTTAKASIVENGQVSKTSEYEVGAGINLSSQLVKGGGHALKLSVVDVSEIGAGGGSIVSVDKDGRLLVGPRSAGAVPGPVCYDIGGEEPTLTDALVILGYINPDYLVGGEMRLNTAKSRRVMQARVADALDKDLLEAAHGVQVVAGATMMRAVKAVSTYRGRDPRDFTLFAFGGSGPVLAAEVARQLQMTRIIVPPSPGLFSAFGLLFSKVEHEYVQTLFRRTDQVDEGAMERIFRNLEEQARSALTADGFRPEQMSVIRQADLRYSGQAYELTVPVATPSGIATMVEGFGEEHLRTYGHRADDEPVDLVNLRVVGWADPPGPRDIDPAALIGGHGDATPDRWRQRKAYFGAAHGIIDTLVVARGDLLEGAAAGPLIVEEYDATTVVPPDWEALLDGRGNIIMTRTRPQ
jgi:N-methylhydantoinase A